MCNYSSYSPNVFTYMYTVHCTVYSICTYVYNVCMSVCMSVYVSVYVSVYLCMPCMVNVNLNDVVSIIMSKLVVRHVRFQRTLMFRYPLLSHPHGLPMLACCHSCRIGCCVVRFRLCLSVYLIIPYFML